jgi:two-component system sensor histidine kinase FlrB
MSESQNSKAEELQRAFELFNRVSGELAQSYAALEAKVTALDLELAAANQALRTQVEEKEALSERLRLLLDALPAGVVALDGKAEITEANPAARALLGGELAGRRWSRIAREHLVPTRTLGEWEAGDKRISLSESPLDSAGGKLLLLHDISDAHQMKAELAHKERLAAMGEMAASLAHQLRTPLAAALLYAGNLAGGGLPPAAQQRFAEKAVLQLRRLERLIQDVLLFARGEAIGKDVLPVAGLLAEAAQTVHPLLAAKHILLDVQNRCPEGAHLVGGHKALVSALVSLLENALSASPADTKIRLAAAINGGFAALSVADEGSGIAPELQARIFEPFFTTKGHGTGLGLPIALGVARAHGGRLEVHSTPGKGACFVLSLPLPCPAAPPEATAATASP